MKKYLYHYTKDEVEDAISNGVCWICDTSVAEKCFSIPSSICLSYADTVYEFNCCSAVLNQYGCNGCGGSFDPDYGGEIESETDIPNMCGRCVDKEAKKND